MSEPNGNANFSPKTVLITGASRGIGLGLATCYARLGWHVIATARNPDGARELWELEHAYKGSVELMQLDVTSDDEAVALTRRLEGRPVHLLINNAGVLPDRDASLASTTDALMLKGFTVNVLGPLRIVRALLPNLRAAATPGGSAPVVATLSSKMGSIKDNDSGGMYAYRVSKAAANMLNKTLAIEHGDLVCVVLHPGWVQTDMGGHAAPVSTSDSASGLANVLSAIGPVDTGRFLDFRGREIPW